MHPPPLARLIDRVAQARTACTPLAIRGGGTKAFYGQPETGEPLETRELAGIRSYEPTELVVTALAGTPLAELESALAEQGQYLPFEPPRFAPGGTVGGMVAAGLAGPGRASAGSVRDHVLGVRLLTGRAELLNFGGQVAKNVAGYDVSRLLVGSLGILGVLCEVSLKVLPVSPGTATLVFDADETQALAQLGRCASRPLPITASAWYQERLYVRVGGARAAVAEARAILGGHELAPPAAADWWRELRDHGLDFFALSAAQQHDGTALWRVSIPAATGVLTLPGEQLIEWNGALRWWRTAAPAAQMRAAAAAAGGHATLMRGPDRSAGAFTPPGEVLFRIHRNLKQSFDPSGILNPGRLYPQI